MRTVAEFENAKKRLVRERDEFVKFSVESLVRALLPVVDNFERAMAHAGKPEDERTRNLIIGIEMVGKQLEEVLKSQGLERVEAAPGTTFDPHVHEAIGYVEEEGPEDEITDVIEAGYRMKEKLLRAAKVRVRKAPAERGE